MPGNLPVTRKRDSITDLGTGYTRVETHFTNNPLVIVGIDNKRSLGGIPGTQLTVSEGHPWPPPKGSTDDVGGEFFSQRKYVVKPKSYHALYIKRLLDDVRYNESFYKGPLYPIQPPFTLSLYPPDAHSTNSVLDKAGATAVARCKPTNPVADASTFLGELLKDGIPSIVGSQTWKARTLTAKNAADEYLNVQFGWRPLLSDVNKLVNAVGHANTVISQYERDSGKVVRRGYRFPSSHSSVEVLVNDGSSVRPYGPETGEFAFTTPPQYGKLYRVRETTQHRWFKGAFTYYLPSGYDSRNEMDRIALLAKRIGVSPTPETLWNLAPWSWAVDWFTNTGDVVSNLQSWKIDGLVMRFGYIMEHTIVSDTYTLRPSGFTLPLAKVPTLTFVNETKIRRRANPFGFGVTWDGLSSFQASIAAALGISRKR